MENGLQFFSFLCKTQKTGSDQTHFPRSHSTALHPKYVGVYVGKVQHLHGICRGKGWRRVTNRIAMHIMLQRILAALVLQLGSVMAWVSTYPFKFQVSER